MLVSTNGFAFDPFYCSVARNLNACHFRTTSARTRSSILTTPTSESIARPILPCTLNFSLLRHSTGMGEMRMRLLNSPIAKEVVTTLFVRRFDLLFTPGYSPETPKDVPSLPPLILNSFVPIIEKLPGLILESNTYVSLQSLYHFVVFLVLIDNSILMCPFLAKTLKNSHSLRNVSKNFA